MLSTGNMGSGVAANCSKTFLKSALLFTSLSFCGRVAVAQDTTTADGLFEYARKTAYEQKDYPEAIRLAKKVLGIAPGYVDVAIFTGRVYAWQKNYDSAHIYLEKAIELDPKNEDGYIAYSDLELWNEHLDAALAITDRGVAVFPLSQPLLLRKVKILAGMKQYEKAVEVAIPLLNLNRSNEEVRALIAYLNEMGCKNQVTLKFDYVHFDKQFPDDWRFGSLELVTGTKYGPFVARVNVANRFQKPGLQYEADLYPRISKMFYGYLNAGYGDVLEVFPRWRAGASLFANLPKAFEAEAGARYLHYTSDAYFYTGYIGKYYKRFLFGARVYIAPIAEKFANSTGVNIRYYFGGADDYINISGTKGLSVDDRRFNLDVLSAGQSYFGELIFRKSIRKVNVISINVSLYQTEYLPGITGYQYQAGIGYTKRFW
jgi:YaiO family outer membrane protein